MAIGLLRGNFYWGAENERCAYVPGAIGGCLYSANKPRSKLYHNDIFYLECPVTMTISTPHTGLTFFFGLVAL